jgi:hypothetical protein
VLDLIIINARFFSKSERPSNIRAGFDEESRRTLYLLERYGTTIVIATTPNSDETSTWIETPGAGRGRLEIWIAGKDTEEMIRNILASRNTVSPRETLYVDTSAQRFRQAKRAGVATCGPIDGNNPFADKPLWPIVSIGDVARIVDAQRFPY